MPRAKNAVLKKRKKKPVSSSTKKSSKKRKVSRSKKVMNNNFNSGKYYYFRDHNWEGGWGVKFEGTGEVIARVYDKNYAFLIAELLSKHGTNYTLLSEVEDILMENSKKIIGT